MSEAAEEVAKVIGTITPDIARARRLEKMEVLVDAINLFIEAKITENRGFAKFNTVSLSRDYLIKVLMETI